jgi:hypothetical protein
MYFSATTRQFFKRPDLFGVMFNTAQRTGKQSEALEADCKFMVDNGIFSNKWDEKHWLTELVYWFLPYRDNCYGVIIPDYLYYLEDNTVRGDWQRTLDRFFIYQPVIKRLGFRTAFATQDGMPLDLVPWENFNTLFIGGSNYHKRGVEAEILALEAKKRGKWVHVGRVSSVGKMKQIWYWADSYDGTTFRFAPDDKEEKLIPQMERFFNREKDIIQRKMF